MANLTIKMISVDSILPYTNNARTHSNDQINQIANSIQEFGFNNPILIDSGKTIVAGHGRFEAAKKLNLTEVPTIQLSHLTKAKRKAYILADNRIALNAGWSPELLKVEFESLMEDDFDLGLTGFDQDEIDAYLNPEVLNDGECDADDIPSLSAENVSKLGDIWILGSHRLMCGDSVVLDQVDKLMNGEKADMVFTDPPYGIDEPTDRSSRDGGSSLAKSNVFEKIIGDTSTQTAIDSYNLCNSLDIPILVFWGANYYCHALPQSANWLVWDKREEEKQRDVNSDCELAWVKSKFNSVRIFRHLWNGMMKSSEKGQARVHPTQKPVALAEWAFYEYAPASKSVLDLFGGSGSTLIACEKTGRKCFMMELAPAYCDVIIRRWQKFTGKEAILESTHQTFEEVSDGKTD